LMFMPYLVQMVRLPARFPGPAHSADYPPTAF
jgi:hypothetical protein